MPRWTEASETLSEQLAIMLGQHPFVENPDEYLDWLEREAADFAVPSSSRPILYAMLWTPEGYAIHQGEGCEHEQFGGPLGCWHSKDFTMTNRAVTKHEALTPTPLTFTEEQIETIKRTIARGTDDNEFALFISTCQRTGLDPALGQIFAVKRWDSKERREVMAIQVGIDGRRLIAERSGLYDGQDAIEWLDSNGQWSEVWTGVGAHPVAARTSVYRKDWTAGRSRAVCRWDSYAQTYRDNNQTMLMPNWARMPDVMLGKCAEALALRRAFPAEMSALDATVGAEYDPSLDAPDIAHAGALDGEFTAIEEQPAPAAPQPCEHEAVFDEAAAINKCKKCGLPLEGPDAVTAAGETPAPRGTPAASAGGSPAHQSDLELGGKPDDHRKRP